MVFLPANYSSPNRLQSHIESSEKSLPKVLPILSLLLQGQSLLLKRAIYLLQDSDKSYPF